LRKLGRATDSIAAAIEALCTETGR
jgi:hypothetical protein